MLTGAVIAGLSGELGESDWEVALESAHPVSTAPTNTNTAILK